MKLLCLYQVMFQYRVGTYEAIAKLPGVDFELWHGSSDPHSKLKNYNGEVSFPRKLITTWRFKGKTNNGGMSIVYHPFLFLRLMFKNPDVILTEGASSFITATTVFIYCKLFKKKIIWWSLGALAGRSSTGISGIVHKWIRFMERHCDAIFAYSTQAETYFKTIGVKPQRIFKAINVINIDKKLREIQENGNVEKELGFNLVFVGAITPQKQLEMLVDAVNDLSKEHEDVSLHIIGDGTYLDTIKGYVAQDNILANVVFHGRVTSGLNVLLQKYSVLVLPGLGGLAIVDGMISSLPVISGRADGTELDLISNGENGYVTDVMSKDYLLEKMEYLYNNPEEVKKMGHASFERITGQFSFRNYMKVFESCLRSLGYAE